MPDSYPMRWAGRTAIVTLPQHVSEFNADRIYELLFQVINRGATELVADMTGTGWCDRAGALVVARVRHCAAACGTQLRLVVTAEGVRRMLALDGLDRLIPIYPSLENAVTATAAHSDGFCDTPAGRPDATSEVRSSREQFTYRVRDGQVSADAWPTPSLLTGR